MTAAALQAAVDAVKQSVVKIQEQLAAIKAQPSLIDQAQLDANTADLKAASDTLNAL